ncbi:iron ABC transporter permease [Aeromonas salmonicida]|uniref:Iron ABC transporter permease n=2 Tax=Gammaproteobacteria TaxID=1236 RepID=A0A3L0VS72_ECOLX|nr:iron ABC transporter permease [Aeromonas salmonicida]ATP08023.1 ABC-type transport system permease protein (probable substrate iron) [Aeromonas salmonicida subsp. pectinolytica 34mel]EQC05194.1 ABC-type iron(III) transporter permease [Aeromonas salmonicida subsp. pectinolytica 34mel]TNI21799.1 iron ABC transporter permease [Aeromonas salmonicida]HEH9394013.1 iron ABC transporter permease [Aeromonas salmonicida]HEH9407461.1 iron ABC transporter permease [Aeromonas salmonicida]
MKNCGWIVSSWATALLLGLPVLALIFSAFSADGDLFRHLADTVLLDYLANTLGLVVGVVLLSLLFGVPTAWLVAMCQVPGRRALQWALMLPMAMPSYIVAYVYTDLLDYSGPLQAGLRTLFEWSRPADYWFPAIRSLGGAAWVLALVLFPYVYLLARASFLEQSVSLIHSSRLLGCNPWQSFRRLSLPLARPAIMVAVSLVAMETLADFATVHFFAINTLTTAVYDTWLGYGSLATAAKLSCMMLLAVVLLIALERRSRQRQQVFQKSMGHEQPLRYPLKGVSRWLAGLWCWGLVLAGFGLPFVILLDYGVRYFELSWTPEFLRFAGNSLLISALTALLAMGIALLLGFFRRLDGGVKSLLPLRIAAMGYAMPGTVLAIGVLVPLTALDFGINDLAEWLGGQGPGLLLTGTLTAIVFGYLVRFVAIAIGSVESSMGKISPSLDMAARSLGQGDGGMLRRVHLPLVRRGLFAGAMLVFIESMKELPAALLLRPFNFDTLATHVYQFVSDEMLERGALGAIVIVLVGLLPLIWVNRSLDSQGH